MDNNELKTALLSGQAVLWCDMVHRIEIEYTVSGIIYRNNNGKIKVTAELADKCGRSFIIAEPEKLRFKEG